MGCISIVHEKHIITKYILKCKISRFDGGEYEECRLPGYKNPVRTWQDTHYVSGSGPSRLMLCKIRGFHGGDYEECRLLRCHRVVLVRTDVLEERSASIIRETKIGELGTTLPVTTNRRTRRNFPEDGIIHSHRRENLKCYEGVIVCRKNIHDSNQLRKSKSTKERSDIRLKCDYENESECSWTYRK
jgi:hypothetical protein